MKALEPKRRAVFLDRDGALIEEKAYLQDPEQVVLEEGAGEGVGRLNRAGWPVVMVTNQSGVARGYFTEREVNAVHERVVRLLASGGARLDGIYYCPHYPTGKVPAYRKACDCRKPGPGMLYRAAQDLDVLLSGSYMIGDKLSDIGAAQQVGMVGILVTTGYGFEHWKQSLAGPETCRPEWIARNIGEAIHWILWTEAGLPDASEQGSEEARPPSCGWPCKWISLNLLREHLAEHRKSNRKIVLANGVFDVLHPGHVGYLQAARDLGDVLVVAVNDDASVGRLKGADRPLVSADERVEVLSALSCVDYCVVFGEDTVDRVLETVRPDFHVKGTDYREGGVPEKATAEKCGAQVRIVGPERRTSTSDLFQRMRQSLKGVGVGGAEVPDP